MKDMFAFLTLVGVVIIVGLFLRYGATTVPLANEAGNVTTTALSDLTLSGQGYPYYPPSGYQGQALQG